MSLDALLAFTRRTTELTADSVTAIEGGWIFSAPSIPVAWGLNHVRLRRPVTVDEATALTDDAQADLPFRRITLEGEAAQPELEAKLLASGWRVERDLLMQLKRPAPLHAPPNVDVVLGREAALLELARCWSREEQPAMSDEVLDQLAKFWVREWRALEDRAFGVPLDGTGRLQAKTRLRSDRTIAQVEDVYTLPESRGRGFATALINHAIGLAQLERHELIFIVADADDWPKLLYRRLGFEPVGRVLHFHRELSNRRRRRTGG
jgi:ribosomal protein S18 acetylase RimI-like enzyme